MYCLILRKTGSCYIVPDDGNAVVGRTLGALLATRDGEVDGFGDIDGAGDG
jgi:hypothetical protein